MFEPNPPSDASSPSDQSPQSTPGGVKPRIGLALAGGGALGAIYEIGALCALDEALEGLKLHQLDAYIGVDGTQGTLNTKVESYTKANTSLDKQIASLERYLVQRRSQLEAGFMAMESAQSKMSQMQSQLTNSFGQKK
jgi:hypothetical protein